MLSDFKKLITWSLDEHGDLPWRKKRTLYKTLVSEIMLQQTTVGTVINHYDRFLAIYPDIKTLANSDEESLLVAWKGLGYYRRARNLLKACRYIVLENSGRFPKDKEGLEDIPGVGPYTSSALISIGRDKNELAVDANLERVLARYYGYKIEKGPKLQKFVYEKFKSKKILNFKNKLSYRELNESLMDLGRRFCRARSADCILCPLQKNCVAFKNKNMLEIPYIAKSKEKPIKFDLSLLRLVIKSNNKVLAYKKSKAEWLSGQYELPTFTIACSDSNCKQYPDIPKALESKDFDGSYKTSITKYKIDNKIQILKKSDLKKFKSHADFVWLDEKQQEKLSTASHKALKKI